MYVVSFKENQNIDFAIQWQRSGEEAFNHCGVIKALSKSLRSHVGPQPTDPDKHGGQVGQQPTCDLNDPWGVKKPPQRLNAWDSPPVSSLTFNLEVYISWTCRAEVIRSGLLFHCVFSILVFLPLSECVFSHRACYGLIPFSAKTN